jgi:hypothetical protein
LEIFRVSPPWREVVRASLLQTVMKKYIVEREVGFTLNVEHIPRIACMRYTESYPDVRYEGKEIRFETRDKFYY